MYVVYQSFSAKTAGEVELFADPKTFRTEFTEMNESANGGWVTPYVVIEDGVEPPTSGTFNVSTNMCYIFFAKDKETLRDGMKACPPAIKVTAGRGQFGFFTGVYDFEKAGGWFRARSKSSKAWDKAMEKVKSGEVEKLTFKRAHVDTAFNRTRLMERGYFLIVGNSNLLVGVRNARRMIGSEMSLASIARLMSGKSPKLSREDALGVLMEGLNL